MTNTKKVRLTGRRTGFLKGRRMRVRKSLVVNHPAGVMDISHPSQVEGIKAAYSKTAVLPALLPPKGKEG